MSFFEKVDKISQKMLDIYPYLCYTNKYLLKENCMVDIRLLPPSVGYSSNTYLLSSGGEYAVIDPSSRFDPSFICGKLKYIILTHGHYDHMINISEWIENIGAEVLVSTADKDKLADPHLNCATLFGIYDGGYDGKVRVLSEDEKIELGSEKIEVIKTPGHTEGSISLLVGDALFVGDTIFAGGGYGKCCFPGGNFSQIKESILKLTELDENITVYPGHGEFTTVGQYKKDIFR